MTDAEIIELARETFSRAQEREEDTRTEGLDDLKFARLGIQWPEKIKREREAEGRPCLTINKLPAFIRQVVNDARQNKPAIVVNPADDAADPETAEIINGLIRNIEVSSDADIATDTAIESAVSNGFGYFRINIAEDDRSGVKDIVFERIANPFSVFADPYSETADSSDWNTALVATTLSKAAFELQYKGKEAVDWDGEGYVGLGAPWIDDDQVMVAEFWHRVPAESAVYSLSDGTEVEEDWIKENGEYLQQVGIAVVEKSVRKYKKVTQYVLTGAEIIETIEWPGCFIPIVPVYGDEINVEGKRYFRSLINPAKDAQRQHNYWRTMATELVALAPKAPWLIEEGGAIGPAKWATANTVSHAYLEYKKGYAKPERQMFSGVPAGALQEALSAADDMKAIIGIYDAALGARSNETSGTAINARKRESDVSTFHFIDNLSRSIRHAGRVVIDLIQKVYTTERIVRVLGEDMKPRNVQLAPGGQGEQQGQEQGEEGSLTRVFDVSVGKYDLVVKAGPSYSSLREETRAELVEIIRSVPESASILGPMYLRHSDWPGADEAADKLEQGGGNPEQADEVAALRQQLADSNLEGQKLALEQQKLALEGQKIEVSRMQAKTDRIRALAEGAYAGQTASNPYQGLA